MNLREVFTPLFAYVLFTTRPSGTQPRSAADIHNDMDKLFTQQQKWVTDNSLSQADYENARFAVVAWIDECILRFAKDTNKQDLYYDWQRSPLHPKFKMDSTAGHVFFDRLNGLKEQRDVREIYYLCLCFGFRGSHMEDSPATLLKLRQEYTPTLPVIPVDPPKLEQDKLHISPELQNIGVPPRRHAPPPPPLWPKVAVAGSTAVVLAVLLWPERPPCGNGVLDLAIGEQCDISISVPQCDGRGCQPNCTCPPPPCADQAAINTMLTPVLTAMQCAKVTAQVDCGIVTLEGQLQNKDRPQIVNAVRAGTNVKEVRDNTVATLEWPFCQVVDLLTPFQPQAAAGTALAIALHNGCNSTYSNGTTMTVQVTGSNLNNVYVDAYGADHVRVAHVVPNVTTNEKGSYPGSTSLTIDGNELGWKVESPFGQEMITVISSRDPLFFAPRAADFEDIRLYLSDLEQRLKSVPPESVSAAICPFTTVQ